MDALKGRWVPFQKALYGQAFPRTGQPGALRLDQQIHFGMEASGVYGKALLAALHQAGLAVSVLNPAQVKFFALSVLRRTKNDTVDAAVIARFCLERKPLATRPLRSIEEQLKSNCW